MNDNTILLVVVLNVQKFEEWAYDLSTLDDFRAGIVVAKSVDDELELGFLNTASDSWDPASLLLSLGI